VGRPTYILGVPITLQYKVHLSIVMLCSVSCCHVLSYKGFMSHCSLALALVIEKSSRIPRQIGLQLIPVLELTLSPTAPLNPTGIHSSETLADFARSAATVAGYLRPRSRRPPTRGSIPYVHFSASKTRPKDFLAVRNPPKSLEDSRLFW